MASGEGNERCSHREGGARQRWRRAVGVPPAGAPYPCEHGRSRPESSPSATARVPSHRRPAATTSGPRPPPPRCRLRSPTSSASLPGPAAAAAAALSYSGDQSIGR
uniref:Uncharacterized protein n=1 Tax=Aegilops tauschii TaxID=37682 RepID=R7W2P5_AEGTA